MFEKFWIIVESSFEWSFLNKTFDYIHKNAKAENKLNLASYITNQNRENI